MIKRRRYFPDGFLYPFRSVVQSPIIEGTLASPVETIELPHDERANIVTMSEEEFMQFAEVCAQQMHEDEENYANRGYSL